MRYELSRRTLATRTRRLLRSAAALPASIAVGNPRSAKLARGGAARVSILCYHRIVADAARAEREAIPGLITSVATFRRHMQIVRDSYDVLPLEEAIEVLRAGLRTKRPVAVITFDDGYRDVYDNAVPVLEELRLPATFFVPTAYIGAAQAYDHDRIHWLLCDARRRRRDLRSLLEDAGLRAAEFKSPYFGFDPVHLVHHIVQQPLATRSRVLAHLEAVLGDCATQRLVGYELMGWRMLTELADAGFTVGSHTARHAVLPAESPDVIRHELAKSKQTLEEKLGRPVKFFAYPVGRYDGEIKRLVAQAGYEAAVTTDHRTNRLGDDLLALGRICCNEELTRGVTGGFSERAARARLGA